MEQEQEQNETENDLKEPGQVSEQTEFRLELTRLSRGSCLWLTVESGHKRLFKNKHKKNNSPQIGRAGIARLLYKYWRHFGGQRPPCIITHKFS